MHSPTARVVIVILLVIALSGLLFAAFAQGDRRRGGESGVQERHGADYHDADYHDGDYHDYRDRAPLAVMATP